MRFFRRRERWHECYPEVRKGGVAHNPTVPNAWICGTADDFHVHGAQKEVANCKARRAILAPSPMGDTPTWV